MNRALIRNIARYPDAEALTLRIRSWPRHLLLAADQLAREAGTVRAINSVMLGATANYLIVSADVLRCELELFFTAKGADVWQKRILKHLTLAV